MIKGVIFDFDGTLAATLPVVFTAFRCAVGRFTDREFSDREIISFFGPNDQGIIKNVLPDDWEECYCQYVVEFAAAHHLCPDLFPGMRDALDKLREYGIQLAIVTGRGPDTTAISTKCLGITSYFSAVETGGLECTVKSEKIARILAGWNIAPEEAAYVGDMVPDIVESRKAGVIPLAAAWDENVDIDALQAAGPDAFFCSVPEMMDWLEERL